jgi:glutamate-ammonia-ligase adenylyltransferase
LLLRQQLSDRHVENLLAPVGFADWKNASRCLHRIAGHSVEARLALAEGLPSLLIALSPTPSPDRVLVNFERFIQSAGDPPDLLRYLARNPRGFEILFTLFTGSQFLTEILLRHPEYFDQLVDHKRLAQTKTSGQLRQEVQTAIAPYVAEPAQSLVDPLPALDALRRFQRRELLRIGTCDLLDLLDLPTVTAQLSQLADQLIEACLTLAALRTQTAPQGFVVLALGKLGGGEINYSSDIDLLFLAASQADRYVRLGQQLIDALARNSAGGFLYRVDMRLRAWGRSGALVNTVDTHLTYLRKHAGLWERQALLKARPVAGNLSLGYQLLSQARPIIFSTDQEPARAEIHNLKQRIEDQLHQRGRSWGEIKLGQGSIRDIEFVTQYLQLVHGNGQTDPVGNSPNTLQMLTNLSSRGILPGDEYRVLTDGYIFLRTVEHHLQLMDYRQTHSLPGDDQALTHLARRLGFQGPEAGAKFTARYQQHSAVIRAVYHRHLANGQPGSGALAGNPHPPDVLPLLTRMDPTYAETFSDADIEHHARLIERLDQDNLVEVEAVPLEADLWQVTVVGYDYLGELSLICGLLFLYGFNIVSGEVFTYGPAGGRAAQSRKTSARPKKAARMVNGSQRQKIVDVFSVRPVAAASPLTDPDDIWLRYTTDLTSLCQRLQRGEQREAQGELAKRVAVTLANMPTVPPTLLPVDIEIDNEASESRTVLQIAAVDTPGFLYELTNALALTGSSVQRMTVASVGNRVQDTLYVTDAHGQKIVSFEKQRELRVATVLIKHFTHLLPQSPNPESALLHFRELIGQLFRNSDWPDEIASIRQPEVLGTLARLLGVSDFLWNDFLRMQYANLFPVVRNVDALATSKSKRELRQELALALQKSPKGQVRRDTLNAFKDREMFRIDMRQIQEHITEFGQFSSELTDLAEVVVEAAYRLAAEELRTQHGLPRLAKGRDCPLIICGLGKCGGRELGFASDIELMFIFSGQGRTTGPRVITASEFFDKLVQDMSQTIQAKREGVFEVDLRLRPYGSAGSLAVSLESFRKYFGPDGDAWPYERQALVKLRPLAGDLKFGMQIVSLRDNLIYTGEPFDTAAMRAMRERQLRHLVTAGTINAKFSPGGLVDIEYLVQGLQISFGQRDASYRQTNTGEAMRALAAGGIIPAPDFPRLREAHRFIRRLINALRMVRGNAKDLTVPDPTSEEFAFLARRLHYDANIEQLQADLTHHTTFVHELNLRLLQ